MVKCVLHVNHCERCFAGIGIYQECSPTSYAKGAEMQAHMEHEWGMKYADSSIEDEKTSIANNEKNPLLSEKRLDKHGNEYLYLCECCQQLPKATFEEKVVDKKNQDCVWEPQQSELFKQLMIQMSRAHSKCPTHDWHCEVCGKGIKNENDGIEYQTQYDWLTSQTIAYPEIDHYKCNQCSKDAQNVLPSNIMDWYRKDSYLIFLQSKRQQQLWSECTRIETKKRKAD